MTVHKKAEAERAQRFREAALPCLDDAYALAYFLMRNRADAEDAVQECYLRALRYFDHWRGPAVKPWLFGILRNVCYSELARRGRQETCDDPTVFEHRAEPALWQAPPERPDNDMIRRQEGTAVRELIEALPPQFREVVILREFNAMSYGVIAEVTGVPIGTVMSRLARARALLVGGWEARKPIHA
jgi:RNA polymerase sigma-70 factor (ECF subfamily)